jgi:hypothetical protein
MKVLRPPRSASPVTYLFRFRCPRESSFIRARCCQRSRAGGGPASGQDHCSAGDPIAGSLSRGREWAISGFQAIRPVPLPRSKIPAEPATPHHLTGAVGAAPASSAAKASAWQPYRDHPAASAPAVYASRVVLPPPMQDSLPAGWLAFTGWELNPLDRDERFQVTFHPPFLDLS